MISNNLSIYDAKRVVALGLVGVGTIFSVALQPVLLFLIPVSIVLSLIVAALDYGWFKFVAPMSATWRVHHLADKWSLHHYYLWVFTCMVFFVWAWQGTFFHEGTLHIYLFEYVNTYLTLPALFFAWAGLFLLLGFQVRRFSLPILAICTVSVFLGSFGVFEAPSHLASIEFGGQTYHLAVSIDDRNWGYYWLFRCDQTGIFCRGHEIYAAGWHHPAALIIEGQKLKVKLTTSGARTVDPETIYTLDALGNQWCANSYFCRMR